MFWCECVHVCEQHEMDWIIVVHVHSDKMFWFESEMASQAHVVHESLAWEVVLKTVGGPGWRETIRSRPLKVVYASGSGMFLQTPALPYQIILEKVLPHSPNTTHGCPQQTFITMMYGHHPETMSQEEPFIS